MPVRNISDIRLHVHNTNDGNLYFLRKKNSFFKYKSVEANFEHGVLGNEIECSNFSIPYTAKNLSYHSIP